MPALTFYLNDFDASTTSLAPTMAGAAITDTLISNYDISFNINVTQADARANFWYKTLADGIAVTATDDIMFRTAGDCIFDASNTPIGNGQCQSSSSINGGVGVGGTYEQVTAANLSDQLMYNSVGTEYVLYLAHKIFNDAGAHAYFANEHSVSASIDVNNKFTTSGGGTANVLATFVDATKNAYVSDETSPGSGIKKTAVNAASGNLGLKIWEHIVAEDSDRLTTESGSQVVGTEGVWHKIPINTGDIFQIQQTIAAHTTLGVYCAPRTYVINYVVGI